MKKLLKSFSLFIIYTFFFINIHYVIENQKIKLGPLRRIIHLFAMIFFFQMKKQIYFMKYHGEETVIHLNLYLQSINLKNCITA